MRGGGGGSGGGGGGGTPAQNSDFLPSPICPLQPAHFSSARLLCIGQYTYQNETCNAVRNVHWSYVNYILLGGLGHGDTKPFYNYIKSQEQGKQGVSPLKERGQLFSATPSKARILNQQFRSVFTQDDPDTPQKHLPGTDYPDVPLLFVR